jgi:hypothetical protein
MIRHQILEDVTAERRAMADTIERFLNGQVDDWEWDDFISIPVKGDKEAEALRIEVANTAHEYPSDNPSQWCNDDGIKRLLEIANRLQAMAESESGTGS